KNVSKFTQRFVRAENLHEYFSQHCKREHRVPYCADPKSINVAIHAKSIVEDHIQPNEGGRVREVSEKRWIAFGCFAPERHDSRERQKDIAADPDGHEKGAHRVTLK